MTRQRAFPFALAGLCLLLGLSTSCRAGIVQDLATPSPLPTDAPSPTSPSPYTPTPTMALDSLSTPAQPAPADGALIEHTVQPGDTLLGIATTYDVPMAAIQLENGMGDSVVVQVGQVLDIPSADGWEEASRFWVVHVVKAGETLVGIAQGYGLKAAEIKAVNGLADADLIRAGQELVIPLGGPAAPTSPPPTNTPPPTSTPTPLPAYPTVTPTLLSSSSVEPTVAPAATLPPAVPPPANVAAWPYEIARLINEVRAQHGLPPLAYNETLAQVAQAHANDCLDRGWGSHYGSDGSNLKIRMERAGYAPARWSECWAHVQSPRRAIEIWMDEVPPNDPHRRTILSTYLTEVGVGVVQPQWNYYFFADFGTPRE
jgi:uncharacterized protein YkwD